MEAPDLTVAETSCFIDKAHFSVRNRGFGLLALDSEPTEPATWLDYSTVAFTAKVGEVTERNFTVTVPDGTPPGESVTGIAMQTADPVIEVADEGMFRYDQYYFAVVDATISNTGDPVGNSQLSLLVSKDGEEVDRFPISQALSLQTGDTAINTRYIPLDGWSSGEWTFELLLEQVEGSGAAVVVASLPIEGSITIP